MGSTKSSFDGVVAECRKALEREPNFAKTHVAMGLVLAEKWQVPEALATMRKACQIASNPTVSLMSAQLKAASGNRVEAEKQAVRETRGPLGRCQRGGARRQVSDGRHEVVFPGASYAPNIPYNDIFWGQHHSTGNIFHFVLKTLAQSTSGGLSLKRGGEV